MVISRRSLLLTAGSAGTAAVLTACAAPGTPQPDAATTQPARISVMFPGGGSEDDDFKPVFDAFHQKHPKITAEWTPGGTGGYNDAYTEKLTSLFAAGSGADVFKTTGGFGSFAESGTYKPLDDYMKKNAADVKVEDYFSQHVEAGKYKGKQLSLSH